MNNYNYDDEIREERLAREIGRKFAELGFGTVQFGEIGELNKAVCFIIFPFVAYLVSYVCEKIHIYFEENAY